jgi:hypothetical protein
VDAIRALLADDLYLPQKQIAFILNIHQGIVKHILCEKLSLRKIDCKWMFYPLEDDQN